MRNTIEQNYQTWNEKHSWSEDGDEWTGLAKYCGVPYSRWSDSLAEHMIIPFASENSVLEIGPGHGRWTKYIVAVAKKTILVDLSPNCISFCKNKFSHATNIEYHLCDGRSLPSGLCDIDFVFSYDAFVHMDGKTIAAYLREISRILRKGGIAVIHHANRKHIWLSFLRNYGYLGRVLYRLLSQGWQGFRFMDDGWRSDVSKEMISKFAEKTGLIVDKQIIYWENNSYGVPVYNDRITIMLKG